ncbi:MAG: DUF2383 domain-containing protein [Fibrobacter sp.]|nr:DUF2383 domain-containing protein [Fibrobacter sp.]
MNNKQLADSLKELVKLYSDSAWNYERALDQVQDEELKPQLAEMHEEHLDHMENLNSYIRQLGEMPPEYLFSGEMSSELKVITNELADDEIIRFLRENEKVLSKKLQVLVENVQIPEIVHDLEEDLEDENEYIETLQNFMS